jgi:3-deoxy-D-manno-octulosonic-acid transferase
MYLLYSCVSAAALLLASPWLAWQAVRHGKYRHNLRERLGSLPAALNARQQPSIWIHAVSVGEVLAARALLPGLRTRYPDLPVFVSTTTRTGREVAEAQLRDVAGLFYFPLDFAWVVRRVVRRIRPRLFVVVETEIWPHVLRACRRHGVPAVLVNARISDRSFPRYRAVRALLRRVLADFSRICAQSDRSATRLLEIGAPADRVVMTGSLKYDALDWSLPDRPLGAHTAWPALQALATRPVFVAASTLRGEDELVLDAFEALRARVSDAALLLAPRHPERFDEVADLVRRRGHVMTRRTALGVGASFTGDVLVLDTVGELASLFGFASVVFVGGSLVDRGGHNVLEPALFARAIVVGPSMHNFPDIAEAFLEAGAMVQVESGDGLTREVLDLMIDAGRRDALGQAARALAESHRGARQRTLDEIASVFPPSTPSGPIAATVPARQERA